MKIDQTVKKHDIVVEIAKTVGIKIDQKSEANLSKGGGQTSRDVISSNAISKLRNLGKKLLADDRKKVIHDSNEKSAQKGEEKRAEVKHRKIPEVETSQKESKSEIYERAQIVQLKKPSDEFGKVVECYVEFLTGNLTGKRVLIENKKISSLRDANLIYNIWPGEPCIVWYQIVDGKLKIVTVKLKKKFPETPEERSENLTKWLRDRGLTNVDFDKWIKVPFSVETGGAFDWSYFDNSKFV